MSDNLPARLNIEAVHVKSRPLLGGVQHEFTFPNGRGASVVQHSASYGGSSGLWEVAVLGLDGDLDYSTPITSDVIGWLDEEQVGETLRAIAALDTGPEGAA